MLPPAFWGISECCPTPSDGLTTTLRRTMRSVDDLLVDGQCRQFLADVFREIPVSTILVEDGRSDVRVKCCAAVAAFRQSRRARVL